MHSVGRPSIWKVAVAAVFAVAFVSLLSACGANGSLSQSADSAAMDDALSSSDSAEEKALKEEGSIADKRVLVSENDSNKDGHVYDYDVDGNIIVDYEYDFDSGRLDACTLYCYGANGKLRSSAKYDVEQYDAVNQTYRLGDLRESWVFEYDGDAYSAMKIKALRGF